MKNFLAYDLAVELHKKVQVVQAKPSLKDQMTRASESIVLNLAEGSGKPTLKDKKRFYAIAFGSIREVQAVFDLLDLKDTETLDLVDHLAACVYKLTYP